MFDMSQFGSSFRGGPLNGFDAMVISEYEKRRCPTTPPPIDLDTMVRYLIEYGYLDIEDPMELNDYTPEAIQDMYNHYKRGR